MAHTLSIPFYAFKLHLPAGKHLFVPLTDPQAVRLGHPLYLVAGQYAEELQRKVLNQGEHRALLDEYRTGDFYHDSLRVAFGASRDGISFPAFELEFDYFYNRYPGGTWGIVPALSIEAFASREKALARHLAEAVRLDFIRNKRLTAVQEIVSTIWFKGIELMQQEISLQTPGPKEVDELLDQPREKLLPQVAQPLRIDKQVTFGRQAELDQFARALQNKFSRNVLLVGPSGVGKTALVWEISRQMPLRQIRGTIWESTASTLIKELTRQTGWQDNLAYLCRELAQTEDILFVRNLMELFEVGKYEGNEVAIADFLRSYLSRGELSMISECTDEEMALIELKSPNYLANFQIIRLEEPQKELESIILQKIKSIADDRALTISEEAVREIIRLNRRFMPYSGMPGKPIRFLESLLLNATRQCEQHWTSVSKEEVIAHFCEDSGMPPFMIDPSIPMDTDGLKKRMNANVFGQEEAVEALVDLLASVKTALTRTGKPIASLLFAGPTGVGKTELAKVLAEIMFGHRERLTRFDMSEFSSPFAVMRLTGTGYFSEGLLTSAVRREPFTVLLFDEVEKAHPSFYDLLLQILSEGRLTDSRGRLVNFCSTIIIMTSNIGAEQAQGKPIGWDRDKPTAEVRSTFLGAVQRYFRPELFNRIDQVIPFASLSQETVRHIVEREIELFRQREGILFRRMSLDIDRTALHYLAYRGYNSTYGARHLQRTIREELVLPLARILNAQDVDDQLMIKVSSENDELKINAEADPLSIELLLEELDQIQFADEASGHRRKISQLQEAPAYIQLVNELERLERKKKQKGKKFWKNTVQAQHYTTLLQNEEQIRKMSAEVAEIEMTLGLSCLNLKPYEPKAAKAMQRWERDFFDLKVNLYTAINPEDNKCYLAIYGKNPIEIAGFYRSLFDKKGFSYRMKAVWFRAAHYEATATPATGAKTPKRYIEQNMELDELPMPSEKGDLLYGIEFELKGKAVYLYLREEEGIQRWQQDAGVAHEYYYIMVANEDFDTPDKIHRKDFYKKQSPRRMIELDLLKDILYKFNREIQEEQRISFMEKHLDKRFEVKLNMEVL